MNQNTQKRGVSMVTRRHWLKGVAGVLGGGLAANVAADCPITPRMGPGPFYPAVTIPKLVDLTQGGKAAGEPTFVFGQVLDRDCKPIFGAAVEIWQCDNNGRYRQDATPGDSHDPGFAYFAHAITDQQGAYFFKTILPVRYGSPGFSRAPHIHYKVHKNGFRQLVTEMHFAGDRFAAVRDQDPVLDSVPRAQRAALIAAEVDIATIPQLKPHADGKSPCRRFDLILDKA
ncbi:dioxygenase family protein [Acanthopleuribacter pedis]|uniref:Intradiol ring-cleavage dioxygenases domain-containing protein n=1 Tax=Acanthopleuribacter pedis TaxID=442870 RepID=A0A8J7QBX7_9BACT|nr:hypothetical protein [Acanthopleuribacter pedis]MBO1320884.1 hypothetical protein [Acanthopleuribacter pedis]